MNNPFGGGHFPGSGGIGSPHADVLDAAIPVDGIGKTVLLGELKNRAKAAVLAQMWPDACALYQKAILVAKSQATADADTTSNKQEQSILHSNLSLCLGKLSGWQTAHQHATTATELDATYAKAWWRLGQAAAALEDYNQALSAMTKAAECEPTNKAITKETAKMKQKQAESAMKATTTTAAKTTTTTTRNINSTSASSATKKKGSAAVDNKDDVMDADVMIVDNDNDDDKDKFTESDVVRGYKIVNGKKTSYFHNELSEDAAKLIGCIAPKRLEQVETANGGNNNTPSAAADNDTKGSSRSVWNKAGTWEERDVTNWATQELSNMLLDAKTTNYTFRYKDENDGDGTVPVVATVSKATVTGSASVATVRGNKKYIYELSIAIDWKVQRTNDDDDDDDEVLASGSLHFPDIDGTCMVGEPYDATDFTIKTTDSTASVLQQQQLRANILDHGLRDVLHKAIDAWVERLKENY